MLLRIVETYEWSCTVKICECLHLKDTPVLICGNIIENKCSWQMLLRIAEDMKSHVLSRSANVSIYKTIINSVPVYGINIVNRCYFGLQKHMKSHVGLLSRSANISLYKTLIRWILVYGNETSTLSKANEHVLQCFERKILRRIFPVCEDSIYKKRQAVFKDVEICKYVRLNRLKWTGHIIRKEPIDIYISKRVMTVRPEGRRKKGRPRLRWINCDANAYGIRNWRMDREKWKKLLKEAMTHQWAFASMMMMMLWWRWWWLLLLLFQISILFLESRFSFCSSVSCWFLIERSHI